MKQMEYTVKVITDGTIDVDSLVDIIKAQPKVATVEVSTFRVVKQSKVQA